MNCNYKLPDGKWNVIEGPDELGRVRVKCTVCGRLYPSARRPPRKINNPVGKNCGIKARRAAKAAEAKQGGCKACTEKHVNNAERHYRAMLDAFAKAYEKGDADLKAAIFDETEGIAQPNFKKLRRLAIFQTLQEGQEHEHGTTASDSPESPPAS